MKKALLISACALGTMMAVNAQSTPTLTMKWLNEGVAPLSGVARQGVGLNGKFYILNSQYGLGNQGWIEVWDENGLVEKIQPEGIALGGTNICVDDAGNIIARKGAFPGDVKESPAVVIYNPETGAVKEFSFATEKIFAGRIDFWGHVSGDVLSEDGGLMLFGTSGQGQFNEVRIVNGEHVLGGQQGVKNNYWFPAFAAGETFGTTGIMNVYEWLPGECAFMTGPGAGETPRPIYHMYYDKSGETWVWKKDGEYYTPMRNITSGFELFKMGSETYIVYSRGGNNADAIAISKAVVKKDVPAEGDEVITEPLVFTYGIMNETETNTKYNGTQNTAVHFNVEVSADGKTATIYQYSPRNFVAVYEFSLGDTTGIEAVENAENAPVEYYNLQGVRVQNPDNGVYIMRQGNKATKVVK